MRNRYDSKSRKRRSGEPTEKRTDLLSRITVGYAITLLLVVFVIRTFGDVIAPLTFYLYSPRWVILLPTVVLVLLCIWRKSSRLAVGLSLLSFAAVLVGLLDYRLPLTKEVVAEPKLRVMTFNALMSSNNADAILGYTKIASPDIVGIQESRALNVQLPEEFTVYRYGELSVATKHSVVSCPESQYAFKGELADLRIYGKPFQATEVKASHRTHVAGEQATDSSLIRHSLSENSRGGQEIEVPGSRLPAEFTIELKLRCEKSELRQFIFEFGSLEKGLNAYLKDNTISVGAGPSLESG